MIRVLDLPGYWYCAARPGGAWVASPFIDGPDPSHVMTDHGRITVPSSPRGLIWTVIGPDGRFAGSGHSDPHAWEWDGTQWHDRGVNEGLHAVLYRPDGELLIVRSTQGNTETGALGWRYIDDAGRPVPAYLSYADEGRRIWEYTEHGGITVGQGPVGVEALFDGQRVRLDRLFPQHPNPANCRAVQFHTQGDDLAIAYYFFRSSDDYVACFVWLTVTDLRVLAGSAPEPTPAITVSAIPAFERPMWMAPFYSHDERWGDTPPDRHTGNAIILVEKEGDPSVLPRELARVHSLGKPLIVDGQHPQDPVYQNLTAAYWATANETSVRLALDRPEKPVIAYRDDDAWPTSRPAWVTDRVWPTVQAYRFPGEALSAFGARISSVLARVAAYGRPMGLVTRFDVWAGPNRVPVEHTLECMPLYERWLREYPIVAHLPFADRRQGGISSDVRLWTAARAFQYAVPSGRPNRFDYWRPDVATNAAILRNKLGQSRAAVVLEPELRAAILAKFEQTDGPG